VASWSSLEYSGKWKLLHYAAKRFYAPVIASVFQTPEGEVEIWLTSDETKARSGSLTLQIFDFKGRLQSSRVHKVKTKPDGAVLVKRSGIGEYVGKPEEGFLFLTLELDGTVFRNEHFFCTYKSCGIEPVKLAAKIESSGKCFRVSLSSEIPAFFVSLQAENIKGEFDDNMLTLVPGETRVLTFKPKEKVTLPAFRAALRLNSLH
ncbi:MAG: hypothetical protein HQL31_08895, partial [Planctomycetes bacterium]|nr:hypothetical protein [Planctomycetota bacterium]